MRIAVIGAGAVGSYYAALLTRAGTETRLLARGAHLDRISKNGLSVVTPSGSYVAHVDATDDVNALIGAEYALLTVKGFDLGEIAPLVRSLAVNGTIIVPLLNGVDIADRVAELGVPREQIIEGLTTVSVVRMSPGIVELRSPFQRVILGEPDGELTARAVEVGTLLYRAGIQTRVSREIRLDLWRKFAFLAPLAAACGLRREPIGDVLAERDGRALLSQALREVMQVGRATGLGWGAQEEDSTLAAIGSLPLGMKPSFLVDIERGRKTEIDTLSGTIVRLGEQHGIETPVHAEVVRQFGAESLVLQRAVSLAS